MSLTFTDIFCGAGGSSIGLTAAGLELTLAANHWRTAIDTHSANFPHAEHLCADVNNYDMRRLPATDVLWASPICTEASPAGGSSPRRPKQAKRRPRGQLDMFETGGHVEQAGFARTRATFHDVIRATEVHRYAAVLIENVPDVAWKWELFEWWCAGMRQLGYAQQTVCVSSAHIGGDTNPYAPQWRDRLYLVFTRTGIPLPDVAPRPLAWCGPCGTDVAAVQVWKDTAKVRQFGKLGKYRDQYIYVCPNTACGQARVEPYIMPARQAIDWTDVGERIGDHPRGLAASTLARIEQGLRMFTDQQTLITVNHSTGDARALPLDAGPLPTRTLKVGEGFATPPMLVPAGGSWNTTAYPTDGPMRTRTARESEALVVPPFYVKQYGGYADPARMSKRVDAEPLGTQTGSASHSLITTEPFITVLRNHATAHTIRQPFQAMAAGGGHHALVIPYRRNNRPTTTDAPLHTMATRDSGALLHPAVRVEDCYFRMLKPREQLRAQRFPDTYRVHGNVSEQTMQAGNAVSANVAQWLGGQVAAALDSRSAS
ncbi:DNA cytosine methyltransferase [Catellatospora chokoriensis]|uniref:DNA (cytosine-5-)-methyltransferase n=1 Tax=Catellatospora chokoriensis TaxID=310353 RepID=A0A8J3JZP9_9ACTN|nr:DNA cytosine methyltransferase [Catellatospora chokoriensis]GIF91379.1 DNA cytosine methyltransferase [Catellatospora chokoriensis]